MAASLFACPARSGRKADAIGKKIHKWRYNVKASPPQAKGLGRKPLGQQLKRLGLSPS